MEKVYVKENLPMGIVEAKREYVRPECQSILIETEGMLCASGLDFVGNSDRFGGRFGR